MDERYNGRRKINCKPPSNKSACRSIEEQAECFEVTQNTQASPFTAKKSGDDKKKNSNHVVMAGLVAANVPKITVR